MEEVELTVDRIAVGGRGLGLGPDGRVTFVEGAVPTERVRVALTATKARHAEGRVVEVLDASPHRIEPACVYAAGECGGCDWQFIAPVAQRSHRRAIVEDALRRIARIDTNAVAIESGPDLPSSGYRTSVRMLIDSDGRLAYRRRRSHLPFAPDSCLVAHPAIDELIVGSRFPGAREVELRVSDATGERMALLDRRSRSISAPRDLIVTTRRRTPPPFIHERVAGVLLQISAGAFFQSSTAGAEALVEVVGRHLTGRDGHLVDLYAGGGLFAGTVGAGWSQVTAVESNPVAVADLAVNAPAARLVEGRVETWQPEPADAVIADPARSGLGRAGADVAAATGAPLIVLVSCDAGSLGRDAGLLIGHGYRAVSSTVLDLFHQTSHVEAVTLFRR